MQICVLSSGSKGNCTYLEINNHKFLIDIGNNFLYVSKKLKEINIDIESIEGIFITHGHKDHVAGLKTTIKKINPKIYLTKKIKYDISEEINNYELINNEIKLDNIIISTISLSHDVTECVGYVFEFNNQDLVYITDTGYINEKYNKILSNRNVYIIESNHDIDLLLNSSKPYFLKARILGDEGHISNEDCGFYLNKFIGDRTKNIILAHLSEENNDKNLALNTVINKINYKNNIIAAQQNERTEVIEV